MARILLGVTGGIAAYKACTLVRLLVRAGHDVDPGHTAGRERFVARRDLCRARAECIARGSVPHLGRCDLLVVAPLTANTLARMAHGLADDVLTEAVLAHVGPVLVAPAMNTRMWLHPATQENVATAARSRRRARRPREGELAEGEEGLGRMAGATGSSNASRRFSRPCEGPAAWQARTRLGGRHAGAARLRALRREPLVRAHGGRARRGGASAGADVTLLAANLTLPAPAGVDVVETPTAADLEQEALAGRRRRDRDGRRGRRLSGSRSVDEQAPKDESVGRRARADHRRARRSGFVAQARAGHRGLRSRRGRGRPRARAREKRRAKNADLFVYNDVSASGHRVRLVENEVMVVSANGDRHVAKAPKRVVAAAVLDEVERLLSYIMTDAARAERPVAARSAADVVQRVVENLATRGARPARHARALPSSACSPRVT